jgi:hypothetical protein
MQCLYTLVTNTICIRGLICLCDCALRYNEYDFFKKMKNTDPLIGAKLKSKTHLQNTFFDFLSRCLRIWLQSWKKNTNMKTKKNFGKKSKKVSKNAEFHADFESVEKAVKKCTKKKL